MAQADSQPTVDLSVHPSPVLLDAVLKVEQVVARLQSLQTTISGIQLSPVNPKHIRSSRANATNRAVNSKDCASGKDDAAPIQRREEYRRKSSNDHNAHSKLMQPEQPLKSKAQWKQWSSPANQVHDVISEILMASEFAKQIATLVAEALQEAPQKTQEPAVHVEEHKKWTGKDGKRRDIAFPSKAQVQKTMSAKVPPSKTVNKFKVAFPSDSTAKSGPAVKVSRPKDLPSKGKSGAASPRKRRISRGNWSNSSSPKSLSPQSPRLVVQTPEKKRGGQKLFSSPNGSFRFSDDADDELSGPRRHTMNVTEIKSSLKPWKLTPTRGVLFSNPVYLASPTKVPPATTSPVKIVPTTGRRRSWLAHQFPKSKGRAPEVERRESTKLRSSASGNPLASSISKVTFKREGPTNGAPKPDPATCSSKREQKVRKAIIAPPSRYIEMVPLDGPQNSSIITMLDVLKVRSPSRLAMSVRTPRQLQPLDANSGSTDCHAVTDRTKEIAEGLQCRVPHSLTKSTPNVEKLAKHEKPSSHSKQSGSVDSSDKENAPVPSCAPAAVMFLRSKSNGNALTRTLPRKNSGISLLQRAKGWMSSQAIKQGRVRELERSPDIRGFTSNKRYSLGHHQVDQQPRAVALNYVHQLINSAETKGTVAPFKAHVQMTLSAKPAAKIVYKFKVIFPSNDRKLATRAVSCGQTDPVQPKESPNPMSPKPSKRKVVHVFKVYYPSDNKMASGRGGGEKPLLGSSLFPGSIEMFLRGPHQWTEAPSTFYRRNEGMSPWLRRAMDWIKLTR